MTLDRVLKEAWIPECAFVRTEDWQVVAVSKL